MIYEFVKVESSELKLVGHENSKSFLNWASRWVFKHLVTINLLVCPWLFPLEPSPNWPMHLLISSLTCTSTDALVHLLSTFFWQWHLCNHNIEDLTLCYSGLQHISEAQSIPFLCQSCSRSLCWMYQVHISYKRFHVNVWLIDTAVRALVWNNGTLLCKIDFNRNLSF